MIWDFTDPVFKWTGWHIFKWLTGIIILTFIGVWFWDVNHGNILEGKTIKYMNKIPTAIIIKQDKNVISYPH